MHVTFSHLKLIQSIQTLSLGQRSQCGDGTDLCLSSGKHGRTVNTWYDISFCSQRTDLCDCTAIRTFVIFQDHLTNSLFLVLVHSFAQNSQPFFIISKCFFQFCCHLTDIFFSCLFVIGEYRNFHLFRCYDLFHRCEQFFRYRTGFIAVFCFSAVSYDFVDKCNDLFVDLISFKNSFYHLCFRNFICSGLNHDDFFSCGSNSQFQVRFCILLQCRVNDQFTIDHTHLCCCTRSVKWDIGDAGCDRGTKHCYYFRIALRIYRHYHVIQGNIITIILREQRTHRTVNHSRCQNRMLGRFSFSLVKSTRDLSYCIHFLFIFYT